MPNKSKLKGNRNENEVAERLSNWWGKTFKRIPNSGALRWNGEAFTYGDLLPPEDFLGVVECKHYKEVDIDYLLQSPDQAFLSLWWDQVISDTERCASEFHKRMVPILIWKRNRKKFRICFPTDIAKMLGVTSKILPRLEVTSCPRFFTIFDLEEFFNHIGPRTLKEIMQRVQIKTSSWQSPPV